MELKTLSNGRPVRTLAARDRLPLPHRKAPQGSYTLRRPLREVPGRLRDERLNDNWFMSLRHARDVIETWRVDYNEFRPHSSLAGQTPREFAASNAGLQLTVVLSMGEGHSLSKAPSEFISQSLPFCEIVERELTLLSALPLS